MVKAGVDIGWVPIWSQRHDLPKNMFQQTFQNTQHCQSLFRKNWGQLRFVRGFCECM